MPRRWLSLMTAGGDQVDPCTFPAESGKFRCRSGRAGAELTDVASKFGSETGEQATQAVAWMAKC